ncbi:methyltransferase-like protein 13-like, partial [Trifolium medium]|nr:methyltransferase-like protein 13-like [Trifolium medium]
TLDSILCGNNSRQNATKMLEEIWRVLKNKGVYILVTYGAPQYRLRLLRESCSWTIKLHVIGAAYRQASSFA